MIIGTHARSPTIGEDYTISCDVIGADKLSDRSVSYQWKINNVTKTLDMETSLRVLTFSPFKLSNAGSYSCRIGLESSLLSSGTIFATNTTIIHASSK